MKPTLQIRLGQSLTLTPQLRLAIRLLQLSAVELELEVNEAVDGNPLLERDEDAPEPPPAEPGEGPVETSEARGISRMTAPSTTSSGRLTSPTISSRIGRASSPHFVVVWS